jgi:hypothetical protein
MSVNVNGQKLKHRNSFKTIRPKAYNYTSSEIHFNEGGADNEFGFFSLDTSLNNTTFSAAIWFKKEELESGIHVLFSYGSTNNNMWNFSTADGTADNISFNVADNGGVWNSGLKHEFDTIFEVGVEYFIVGTYNNSTKTTKIYVNGVEETGTVTGSITSPATPLYGGNVWGMSGVNSPFEGKWYEAAIFDVVLTDTEVSNIYNNGKGADMSADQTPVAYWKIDGSTYPTITDVSANTNDITLTNTESGDFKTITPPSTFWGRKSYNTTLSNIVPPTVGTYETKSTLFDGVDEYASVTGPSGYAAMSAFTVSCWFYYDGISDFGSLISWGEWDGNFSFSLEVANNAVELMTQGAAGTAAANAKSRRTTINVAGKWIHAAATFNSGTIEIWVNGVKSPLTTNYDNTVTSVLLPNSPSRYLVVGNQRNTNNTFNYPYTGRICDVAVFNSALSDANIATLYNNGLPSDISSLSPLSWYKMGDGDTFSTITDHGSSASDLTMTNMESGDFVNDAP